MSIFPHDKLLRPWLRFCSSRPGPSEDIGSRLAALLLRKRGEGKIINIGSIAGEMGIRHVAPYAASNRGVLGVTSTLAVKWACEGICVNCLAPEYIETDLTSDVR